MLREWVRRRYVEADYRMLEARRLRWWDDRYLAKLYRRRNLWRRLGGKC